MPTALRRFHAELQSTSPTMSSPPLSGGTAGGIQASSVGMRKNGASTLSPLTATTAPKAESRKAMARPEEGISARFRPDNLRKEDEATVGNCCDESQGEGNEGGEGGGAPGTAAHTYRWT
jgi:hypothetical protein